LIKPPYVIFGYTPCGTWLDIAEFSIVFIFSKLRIENVLLFCRIATLPELTLLPKNTRSAIKLLS